MELWIARDYNKQLWLHTSKPYRNGYVFQSNKYLQISSDKFPEITWENSPRKVKIELV